ncbi:MAG: hypothetical protein V1899_01905 [Planctomycetota bacterium]
MTFNSSEFSTRSLPITDAVWRSAWLHGALLAVGGLVLLLGCWNVPFIFYDDQIHVSLNYEVTQGDTLEFFKLSPIETYFPVTKLSYRFDYLVFVEWLHLKNWAPGVRLMTCLYHILAAIFVWRIMLRLRLSRWQALFIGLAFVAHPLACETVCWVSERKNALAGLFGFAAVWAWLRWSDRAWRLPMSALLYGLACLAKPSALGIFPVLALLEIFKACDAPDDGQAPAPRAVQRWWRVLGYLMPLALISVVVVKVNLIGHATTIVEPPGGSIFTAMLTDLEIVSRYLFNVFIPVALSAVYFVDPITSVKDARVIGYALLLTTAAITTTFFSANRRRTIFAWLWFVGALGPNLNLIAIPHFMQDRYLYLSTPAFFLILVDFSTGLIARIRRLSSRVLFAVGTAYLIMLVALASVRSSVFDSMMTLFADAVKKQPQAAFAHWGLGAAYSQAAQALRTEPPHNQALIEQYRSEWREQWRISVDECPDTKRFAIYSIMAMTVGEDCNVRRDLVGAERYWTLAAEFSGGQQDGRSLAMGYLSSLRMTQNRPEEAYRYANEGLALVPDNTLRLARAKAALALAKNEQQVGDKAAGDQWVNMAREDLNSMLNDARVSEQARRLLNDPRFWIDD